jgi:N-dimethylarginine dimethylaminohydrolase
VRTFRLHEPINATQRYTYATDPPKVDVLVAQQEAFVGVLRDRGVEIHWATPRSDSPLQLNTRDIATVIGETLIITSMKEPIRQNESLALHGLLSLVTTPVVQVDAGVVEGGDIIIDGNVLFVGLSERTDTTGLDWMVRNFSNRFQIVPLRLRPPFLHLDVVFNLVGQDTALVHSPGLDAPALETISNRYRVIEVTPEEQEHLGTNVLSLSPEEVIADSRNSRIAGILRSQGLHVIELSFSEVTKIGGSFRCATCPLIREELGKPTTAS